MIENALKIDGWMSGAELNWLATTARDSQLIIEVGCYKGRSTRALADSTYGLVYAVDPWNGIFYREDGSEEFRADSKLMSEFIENTKDCKNILIFRGTSSELRRTTIGKVDFVFIDGSHIYSDVKTDIENSLSMIKSGGIISGHDYGQANWPGVKEAVDEVLGHVNLLESIWWTKIQ